MNTIAVLHKEGLGQKFLQQTSAQIRQQSAAQISATLSPQLREPERTLQIAEEHSRDLNTEENPE